MYFYNYFMNWLFGCLIIATFSLATANLTGGNAIGFIVWSMAGGIPVAGLINNIRGTKGEE